MLQQKNLTNPPAGAHDALHICALYGDHHGVPDESGHHVSRIRNGASLHDKCDECLPGRHASGFLLHTGCPSCCYQARRIDRSRSLRQSACPLRAPGCGLAHFLLIAAGDGCTRIVAGGKPSAFQMQGEGGQVVQILTCIRMKDTEEPGVRYAAGKAYR